METKEISLRIRLTRERLTALLAFLFLTWHPGFLGSETLTLTTYYPAPYGGYVSLLTTNQTLLARDGGRVGVRQSTLTTDPAVSVDVNGGIKWGNAQSAYSTLGADQGGSIELGQQGGGTPYIDFHFGGGGDYNTRLINDANSQLSLYGNLRMANSGASINGTNMSVSGLCTWRGMGAGWAACLAGENLVNVNYSRTASEWACIGQAGGSCAAGTKTVGVTGTMLCCRLN